MRSRSYTQLKNQHGIALYVVIVLVMMSMLLALWASRTSLFNELIVGNDADYQRAFEAAQALIQDAEFDIRGEQVDTSPCIPVGGWPAICRTDNPYNSVWIPTEEQQVGEIIAVLDTSPTKCVNGICLKRTGNQDFWKDAATLNSLMVDNVGARYGQFTGAKVGASSNVILSKNLVNGVNGATSSTPANEGGWYWIEMMPYDGSAGNSGLITGGSTNLALNLVPNVAYRITAVAHGLKSNTQVVLQTTYVRQKMKN